MIKHTVAIEVRAWLGANRNASPDSTPYWQVVKGSRVLSTHNSKDKAEARAAALVALEEAK